MTMLRLETRACSVSRPRACAPSISNRAAVDLCGLCFFPELGLERATTVNHSVFTTTSRDADMAGDEPAHAGAGRGWIRVISWRIVGRSINISEAWITHHQFPTARVPRWM